jgi:hypothetical protein
MEDASMTKAALVVFADTESHADLARVVNALMTAKEFKENDEDVQIIFDGAGTKWVAELSRPDNRSHGLFESVKDKVAGACSFCASAFGVKEDVVATGIPLLEEYRQHPSLRRFISEGFEVLTF